MKIDDLAELMGISREEAIKKLESNEPILLKLTEKKTSKVFKEKEENLLVH